MPADDIYITSVHTCMKPHTFLHPKSTSLSHYTCRSFSRNFHSVTIDTPHVPQKSAGILLTECTVCPAPFPRPEVSRKTGLCMLVDEHGALLLRNCWDFHYWEHYQAGNMFATNMCHLGKLSYCR